MEQRVAAEPVAELQMKGFSRPVQTYALLHVAD
jgi:hypothetical protein